MGLFRRRQGPRSDRKATKDGLAQLREWCSARRGVEAYVEPRTTVTETTLLLVAGDGEWTRKRVPGPQVAADFARKAGIPVYDTNRVGYPQRMRDFNLRASGRSSRPADSDPPPRSSASAAPGDETPPASPSTPRPRSPREIDAIDALESVAGVGGVTGDPDGDELRRIWRLARSRAHPDRKNGDRTDWDRVEEAARVLGLEGPPR